MAMDIPAIQELCQSTPTRILMLVADGLGGAPHPETGRSELETARLPNLDRLAQESACGRTVPVLPGVSPGSGPAHLALFGYDPLTYFIGRGVLEALGIDAPLREGDVAARGNFCTVDPSGRLVDRRAGRIPNEESRPLCERLDAIKVEGIELRVLPVQDYRFVLILRGAALSDKLSETDPQATGVPPLPVQPMAPEAAPTATAANRFLARAAEMLAGQPKANMVLLRGFSKLPNLPPMGPRYKLRPAAVAAYPMYRGLARTLGMEVLSTGASFDHELDTLARHFHQFDFLYLHYKPADAAGEDGNFEAKVEALEELDARIPSLLRLGPDVLIVAGDHATPAVVASHSWHPVPFLLRSRWTRGEGVERFTERHCAGGSLGTFPAVQVMTLALAHAGKLARYGP